MVEQIKPIVESSNFIVLDRYIKPHRVADSYQSEHELESEFILDLVSQGYEQLTGIKSQRDLLINLRARSYSL